MRTSRTWAATIAGLALLAAGGVAAAGPAAAIDHGPLLDGDIYLFNANVNLDTATAANLVTSGSGAARQWQALAVGAACPEGTTNLQSFVRIPVDGVSDPNAWPIEDSLSPFGTLTDSQGRFYIDEPNADNSGFAYAEVISYLNSHGHSSSDFKMIAVCQDNYASSLAYFQASITISNTGLSNGSDFTWSFIDPPTLPGGGGGDQAVATTTALTAAQVTGGVKLTATVSPPTAAGSVTFAEGATTVGTGAVSGGTAETTVTSPSIGVHNYIASFTPDDAAAYGPSSSTALQVTVGTTQGGQVSVTLGVPAAPSGALTLVVPPGATVALTGTRDSGNTRVTASGTLPQITVTDSRGDTLLTEWQVSVQASEFSGSAGTIAAKYLGWAPATPSITPATGSTLLVQAGGPIASFLDSDASLGLGSSQTLARTTVNGRGTTTLGAQLNLAVPGDALQGSYTSMLTVTLISG